MKNEFPNDSGIATPASSNGHQQLGQHLRWVQQHHESVQKLLSEEAVVVVRGDSLSAADLIAITCHGTGCEITTEQHILSQVDVSVDFLAKELETGKPIYGVSTGFGGSADTRTPDFVNLQKALLQHQQSGILLPADIEQIGVGGSETLSSLRPHSLPRTVVRGAMLARCNSLMRGHSAVRREAIIGLLKLLNNDFIPVVPLRGSISASGDLSPLSYLAGALEGSPSIYVDCKISSGRETLPSNEALRRAGIDAITFGPKEGLGMVNGTTVSCTAAILGLHEAQFLALMTQALTGMCAEALLGTVDNYHPFIAVTRPHAGQIEAAANITRFLQGSNFAGSHHSGARTTGLYQDRYPLRTASQWLAPYLEDLCLAAQQLEVELNSTTDNPLIDVNGQTIHHGGNFQATPITSATEKIRLSLQMFGKLVFTQNAELINPVLNNNLSPNLCFDDPSLSFTFKGVEINMAAYMSELAFLANPVSSHVQPAEMSNQAVNSLALTSARYTMDAVEMVSLMCAAHLYSVCQALDLQAMWKESLARIRDQLEGEVANYLEAMLTEHTLLAEIMTTVERGLVGSKTKDLQDQATAAAEAVTTLLFSKVKRLSPVDQKSVDMSILLRFTDVCKAAIHGCIAGVRDRFSKTYDPNFTTQHLGAGSKQLYEFVRKDLGVPLHRGLVDHATYVPKGDDDARENQAEYKPTIGEQISKIYCAIRDGRIHGVLVESLT